MRIIDPESAEIAVKIWKAIFTPGKLFAGTKITLFTILSWSTFGLIIRADWVKRHVDVEVSDVSAWIFFGLAAVAILFLLANAFVYIYTLEASERANRDLIGALQDPNIANDIKLKIAARLR